MEMRITSVRRVSPFALGLVALVAAGCATIKAPTLQLEGLGVDKVRITGLSLDVGFHVRNPNPEPLRVERFEYELKLNGRRLGRGYYPDSFELAGFGDEKIKSSLDVNFLALPQGVQRILERDEVRAEIKGKFYVQEGGGLKGLGFKSDAKVRIRR
jgi:LEA14-like dessication related protein